MLHLFFIMYAISILYVLLYSRNTFHEKQHYHTSSGCIYTQAPVKMRQFDASVESYIHRPLSEKEENIMCQQFSCKRKKYIWA